MTTLKLAACYWTAQVGCRCVESRCGRASSVLPYLSHLLIWVQINLAYLESCWRFVQLAKSKVSMTHITNMCLNDYFILGFHLVYLSAFLIAQ